MIRHRTHHLLLLAALAHLLADIAFAGGAVLCVGPADHAAIEAGHFAADCQPLPSLGAEGTVRPSDEASRQMAFRIPGDECADCTDMPLHGDAEKTAEEFSWNPGPVSALPDPFSLQPSCLDRIAQHVGPTADVCPTLRAHRSIVLVI
ncbi:MAG TPA: hypothetical protein ENI85_19635 [Deltaproteobacteria bacterium]|nr:hypothetical protein [Deltaproteobacteria bacterium]